MLTNKFTIKTRLGSFNREYYDVLSREIAALWNIESSYVLSTSSRDSFPIWPRIDVSPRRTTEQRPILETAIKILSRILSTNPVPEFSGLDDVQCEVRQKFWEARATGDLDAESDWYSEIRRAFLEGDCLGAGVLQIGLVEDNLSGEQKVTVRHVPIRQVIWDSTAVNPRRSRWVAICDYMDVDEAKEAYGDQHVVNQIQKLPTSNSSEDPEIVPVWHYFDLGSHNVQPTYACIIGDLCNNPFKIQKNPFGYVLPVAWMVGHEPPGYQRPIGRVAKMLGSQLSLNRQLNKLDTISQCNPGFTVVQGNLRLNAKQLELIRQGAPNVVVEADGPIEGVPAIRIPGAEASSTDLQLLREHRDEISRQGDLSELDRGAPMPNTRSATEIGYMQSGVEQSQSGLVNRTLTFLKELMDKVFLAAKLYDRAPVRLNIMGYQVLINGPDSNSTIDKFLADPAELVLTSESLTGQDARVKLAERQQRLEKLAPLAAAGKIRSDVWVEEYLKAAGERDPEKWIPDVETTPPGQPSPDYQRSVNQQAQAGAMQQGQVPQSILPQNTNPEELIGQLIKQVS